MNASILFLIIFPVCVYFDETAHSAWDFMAGVAFAVALHELWKIIEGCVAGSWSQ